MKGKKGGSPAPFREKYERLRERQKKFHTELKESAERVRELTKENTAKAKAKAKKLMRKIGFGIKYTYAMGGRLRNEIVGMLTIYNFGRAVFLHIKRRIRFDPSDEKLYLNIYYPLGKPKEKYKVFLYIHGGGWMGGWPESREAFTTRIATAGYFVASVYYGEAPKYAHPKMIENIYKAIGYLRERAAANRRARTLRLWRRASPQIRNTPNAFTWTSVPKTKSSPRPCSIAAFTTWKGWWNPASSAAEYTPRHIAAASPSRKLPKTSARRSRPSIG